MKIFIVILSVLILCLGIFIPSQIFSSHEIYLNAQIVILLIGVLLTGYNHGVLLLKIPLDSTISNFRFFQWFVTGVCAFYFFILIGFCSGKYHLFYIGFFPGILISIHLGCFLYEIVIGISAIEKIPPTN